MTLTEALILNESPFACQCINIAQLAGVLSVASTVDELWQVWQANVSLATECKDLFTTKKKEIEDERGSQRAAH